MAQEQHQQTAGYGHGGMMDIKRLLRLKPYIGLYRRLDLTPVQTARGWRDLGELYRRVPGLEGYAQLSAPARDGLAAHHAAYVRSVSNETMAASLQLAAFLDTLCRVTRPRRVVDLGSGFSSYVLRRYAAGAGGDTEVWSVDDHAGWLEKTREYLRQQGVDAERVLTWDTFISEVEPGSFDLVLHDMGSMEFRAESLAQVLTLARPGGYVVLDDVHKPDYRRHVHKILAQSGKEWVSLKRITRDRKARYAYLVFA